jgi:hypothetical protein
MDIQRKLVYRKNKKEFTKLSEADYRHTTTKRKLEEEETILDDCWWKYETAD